MQPFATEQLHGAESLIANGRLTTLGRQAKDAKIRRLPSTSTVANKPSEVRRDQGFLYLFFSASTTVDQIPQGLRTEKDPRISATT